MKTTILKLDLIRTDAETQARCFLCDEVVLEYAERMIEGDKFPALDVFNDGSEYFLADGFHRFFSAIHCEFKDFPVNVHSGTRLDALKFALGANQANGLRRTNADKRRAVWLALQNFSKMSDRGISEVCGVSPSTVASTREEYNQLSKLDSSKETKRVGKDGKSRKVAAKKASAKAEDKPEETPAKQTSPTSAEKPSNLLQIASAENQERKILGMIADHLAHFPARRETFLASISECFHTTKAA